MVLVMGPRQVGKTTLAKSLTKSFAYYNYDIKNDSQVFRKQEWDKSKTLVIFDGLHKMKKWKLWLKGLYDEGRFESQQALITGSARLDIAKKMGDSLAGRFFSFRLHPLDLKELKNSGSTLENYKKLLSLGGFPEPFLTGDEKYSKVWRQTHLDLILRQDILTLEGLRDMEGLELLVQMLSERVGSPISINSIAKDLQRDDKTIKKWIQTLENFYVIFKVPPKSKNVARGITKSSKYYFYDVGRVEGDKAAKLENLVALSLKKELEFLTDTQGQKGSLMYARTKDGREIDFFIERGVKTPPLLIEVKLSDMTVSKNFDHFLKFFPTAICHQLVRNHSRGFTGRNGVLVLDALTYLEKLDLEI